VFFWLFNFALFSEFQKEGWRNFIIIPVYLNTKIQLLKLYSEKQEMRSCRSCRKLRKLLDQVTASWINIFT